MTAPLVPVEAMAAGLPLIVDVFAESKNIHLRSVQLSLNAMVK